MAKGLLLSWVIEGVKAFYPRSSFRRPGYASTRWNPSGYHVGVDIGAAVGKIVKALRRGVVTFRGRYGDLGYMITIYDKALDITWGYCHLKSFGSYSRGEKVPTGGRLGRVGMTGKTDGPHLHLFAISGKWIPGIHRWGSMPYTDPRPLVCEAAKRAGA